MDRVRAALDDIIEELPDPDEALKQLVEEWGTSPEAIAASESDFWDD